MFSSDDVHFGDDLFAVSKVKTSPDIFSERQMRGKEWDEPKMLEIAKIKRLGAKTDVCADDPSIKGMQICDFTWAGRCKRNADGSICKMNARMGTRMLILMHSCHCEESRATRHALMEHGPGSCCHAPPGVQVGPIMGLDQ